MDVTDRFNLITRTWLPAIRVSGQRKFVRPSDLTDDIGSDPIVEINWPRADFHCATLEFLIGLLAVACPPRNNEDWQERWERPPSKGELEASLAALVGAFAFDGEGARAYQDFDELKADPTPIEALLIEAPGDATVKKNAAPLVKSGRIQILSRHGAAMALVTLQTMAPAGGAGHRTSLRGGGPLTTLVLPQARISLWHRLWANVPNAEHPAKVAELPRIFPWLTATRLSGKKGRSTTPTDVDWQQAFFGMPRRIRLDFEPNVEHSPCDLTGTVDDVIVRTYRTRPHGTNYDAWGGRHPLTPHYHTKSTDPTLYPVHGQEGRIGYRQWVAMLYGDKDKLREPASCVSIFIADRKGDLSPTERTFRLMAAGYDMDNMKARAFTEAETPDITMPKGDAEPVAEKARDFVAAADVVANALGKAVRLALYGYGAEVGNNRTPLVTARNRFWAETNDSFFETLNDFSRRETEKLQGDEAVLLSQQWRIVLQNAALAIFDDMMPIQDALSPNVKRVVEGRRFLVRTLLGYGGDGVELYKHLQLPAPETKSRKGRAA